MFSIFGFIIVFVMIIGMIVVVCLKLKNINWIMVIGICVIVILGVIFILVFLFLVLNIDLYVVNKVGIYFINMLVILFFILGFKCLLKGCKD